MNSPRLASHSRKTAETDIHIKLNIDGSGKFSSTIDIPFFNHMLNLLTRHALFDIEISGKGDLDVDAHHTVEDCGIVLGMLVREALGTKEGIARYGFAMVPMEECLSRCVLDLCDRPYLVFDATVQKTKVGTFDAELAEEFFRAFAFNCRMTMHLELLRGSNVHHILESLFKALGLALRQAVTVDQRISGVLSTKETI
ncbi:MAG: imidazoleglycerol-phosphate dehydratase HisB [Candidatus Sumerlaeales bacterium]|nr:imidazoleglycerol-phosphate dehydratase HisB [Candidatus Sumerlaeales bacterium]